MLGFGKKNREKKENEKESEKESEKEPAANKEGGNKPDDGNDSVATKNSEPAKKKRFTKKSIFIIFLVLIAIGASGFVVYSLYPTDNDPLNPEAKYKKIELEHINLPEEMIVFTFIHFRKLYVSMTDYNKEINLLNREIERIEAVAQKYPEQKKIADKQKKSWEKVKKTLEKVFIKIEKPIKNMYVLLSVNKEQGLLQIENKKEELSQLAQDALTSANEMTLKLKPKDIIPKGFIKGNIYKLKKKFL